MPKHRLLLIGLIGFAAALCNGTAAPPCAPAAVEKVVAFEMPAAYLDIAIAVCDVDAFNRAAVLDRETAAYAVTQSAAISRTLKHQAKVSAYGRTCRRVAVAADYRSKPSTLYEQRM